MLMSASRHGDYMQEPKSLEDLTGLTGLHAETLKMQQKADAAAADDNAAADQQEYDSNSIPDIDDEWTFT